MSDEKPTRDELRASIDHDPRTCRICCAERHGDQAPTDDECEIDRLRAGIDGVRATLDASLQREREANERIATLREMLQRAKDEAEGVAVAHLAQLNEARAATVEANMALADANERAAAANERADANLRLRMDVLATYVSKEQDRCVAAAEAEARRWREEGCGDERHEFAGHGIDDAVKAMRRRD